MRAPDIKKIVLALPRSSIFGRLTDEQLLELFRDGTLRQVPRGSVLLQEDAVSSSFFLVLTGRFQVFVRDSSEPINEIGAGEPIGEIGFFSGRPRTASVFASRDSVVLELDWAAFSRVAHRLPDIYERLLYALANRLSVNSDRARPAKRAKPVRTVAAITGGNTPISRLFFERLAAAVAQVPGAMMVNSQTLSDLYDLGEVKPDNLSLMLTSLESSHRLLICVVDDVLNEWTQAAIRGCDQVLTMLSSGGAGLNAIERFAYGIHPPAQRRIALIHPRRQNYVSGTRSWLRDRQNFMHHHIAIEDSLDFHSLLRFLTGNAIGFVASG
jgi:NTE family protein